MAFLRERVAGSADPRAVGEALRGERFGEFWKYRVGDYRVIARIDDGCCAYSSYASATAGGSTASGRCTRW